MVNPANAMRDLEPDVCNAYNAAFIGRAFIDDALMAAQQTGVMSRHVSDACSYALWQILNTADEVKEKYDAALDAVNGGSGK
jgi:hypothetical protein